jgi:hypothetical protein
MDFKWAPHRAEQLSWHWEAQLRPRLAEVARLRDLYLRR